MPQSDRSSSAAWLAAFTLTLWISSTGLRGDDFPRLELPEREIAQSDLVTIPSSPGFHLFALSTDVSGRRMAATSEDADREVIVFRRSVEGRWVQEAEIPRPATPDDFRPVAVSIDGDTLALLRLFTQGDNLLVRFFIYERRTGGEWQLITGRTIDLQTTLSLGFRMELAGDALAVGVPTAFDSLGRVWVHERNAGGPDEWGRTATLQEGESTGIVNFGAAVAFAAGELLVGSPRGSGREGRVYRYRRDPATASWEALETLAPPGSLVSQEFGWSVVADDETLAVAAGKLASSTAKRRIVIYDRDAEHGTWRHAHTLQPPARPAQFNQYSPRSVAGGRLAVARTAENVAGKQGVGAVYIHERDHPTPGAWGAVKRLTPRGAEAGQRFGLDADFADGQLLVHDGVKEHEPRIFGAIAVIDDPLIFRDDFESRGRHWDQRANARFVEPGLDGTSTALGLVVEPGAGPSFVKTREPDNTEFFRAGFLINPRGVDLGGAELEILRLMGGGKSHTMLTLARDGGGYRVHLYSADQGRPLEHLGSGPVPGNGTSRVQVDWARASAPGSADGIVRLYTRGTVRVEKLDSTARYVVANAALGMRSGFVGTSGSGTILIDAFISTR